MFQYFILHKNVNKFTHFLILVKTQTKHDTFTQR